MRTPFIDVRERLGYLLRSAASVVTAAVAGVRLVAAA
jgi:hypothetical protein